MMDRNWKIDIPNFEAGSQNFRNRTRISEKEYRFAFSHVIANNAQSRCDLWVGVDFGGELSVFFGWLGIDNLQFHHFSNWNSDDFDRTFVADEELGNFFGAANCCG